MSDESDVPLPFFSLVVLSLFAICWIELCEMVSHACCKMENLYPASNIKSNIFYLNRLYFLSLQNEVGWHLFVRLLLMLFNKLKYSYESFEI